ncbi:HAD-IIA family hydrolase [Lysinibacter cavernae]|uniref:HAD superfamily hydrolase (TIGR01450 family) n=1 Tax=Lysinibacter cavernae TaxID=1640652 RepID=A0A7X5TU90_9MICO|nr:HAD-IIA family hydrolase [Lysinibacter cavernae]NIH53362.1 HAD superfamily hydrolase (TIGR01450 family) [Lysinibacter cavernae]
MALFRQKTTPNGPSPLHSIDLVLADLDGVVYKGPAALPHAVESLNAAAESVRVAYITNNASRTDATVATHLSDLGLNVAPSDVVTSPQAAVTLLAELVPAGSTVLVVGGDGLVVEVERAGFTVTRSADDAPAAVIQGFAPEVGWTQLAEAAFALAAPEGETGIPWVATNTDWTIPVARGLAPGNGTLVSAVHTAVGRLPVFAGKPEVAIFDEAFQRFGSRNALMIGDRLDTDILGAQRAGIRSVHVMTGVDRAKQLLAADKTMRPDFILGDLRELHEPYPESVVNAKENSVRVGDAEVRMRSNVVEIVRHGDDKLNLLRAGCHVIWGSGLAIYGLEVPAELYS